MFALSPTSAPQLPNTAVYSSQSCIPIFQNSHQDFTVIRHAHSVKLAVKALILQTSSYLTGQPGKSHAAQADIFHGTRKIEKSKLHTHQSSFHYDLKSLPHISIDTLIIDKTKQNQTTTTPRTGSTQKRNYKKSRSSHSNLDWQNVFKDLDLITRHFLFL